MGVFLSLTCSCSVIDIQTRGYIQVNFAFQARIVMLGRPPTSASVIAARGRKTGKLNGFCFKDNSHDTTTDVAIVGGGMVGGARVRAGATGIYRDGA